jgi:two-component system sensor histidine kinase PilS (NtrC family)
MLILKTAMDAVAQTTEKNKEYARRVWWLIIARLAVTLAIVAATALWTPRVLTAQDNRISHVYQAFINPRAIFFVLIALSLFYAAMLRFRWLSLTKQVCVQLAADVLLVTGFVWATGDLRSPYTAFYIVIISAASLFLGSRGAGVASIGCATLYTLVMVGVTVGLLPVYSSVAPAVSHPRAVEIIGLNDIGFLVVGLLAARLAAGQTRSDVQLIAATHALANLRAIHERIVESIRSGVLTTDLKGCIYTFNKAAEEMLGCTANELSGREASFIFGDDLPEQIAESLRAARAGEASPRYEADCLTPEGMRLRLGYSIFPLTSEKKSEAGDAKPSGLVITFQDLTQVRALEQSARRQDRLAAVGRVAAGIAHEIRNPLASMRGAIQVLRAEMPDDSSQAELMEIILRESDRLNRIITDFLTYARPKHGEFREIDLRDPLHETLTLLRHSPETLDDHQLEEVIPDVPVNAQADASALRQVFWNLARNALQAMPEGGTLRVELKRLNSARVQIIFSDTGRGMTPEQVERLFEPFASSTTGGTGLGLSIVYQIIRDHGGTINVRSRPQQGTMITIELPGSIAKNAGGVRSQESEVRREENLSSVY